MAQAGRTDEVEAEAAEWVIRLADDAPEAARAEFRDWIGRDPGHAAAFAHAERTWQELGLIREVRGRSRRGLALPLVALLLAGLPLYLAHDDLRIRLQADHVAPLGENLSVTLQDGSRIILASGAALAVDYDSESRLVRLLRGKAYFVPEPTATSGGRAFVVEAGETQTTALGTEFSVDLQPGGTEIIVARHSVRVEDMLGQAAPVVVAEGMGLRTTDGATSIPEARNVDFATAWRRGDLVFDDRPLAEVVEELNRYRHGRIVLRGQALADRRVSGVFHTQDIAGVEARLAAELGLRRLSLPLVTVLY